MIYRGGRVWLLWDPGSVQLQVVQVDEQFINAYIQIGEFQFTLTLVYGSNNNGKKWHVRKTLLIGILGIHG